MDHNQVRGKFLQFFEKRGHTIVPPARLIPENDPTTLFTGSGMQPLVPYLLGQPHPMGTKLVDSQPCFRAEDIDEVGDNRHTTFFEMLGNWSLGEYFKKEQLSWFFQFLVEEIGLNPEKLFVTVFGGDEKFGLAKDEEAAMIWKNLFAEKGVDASIVEIGSEEDGGEKGMQGGRVFYYNSKKNWWSRAGIPENMPIGEPGGGDSEVFYEFSEIEHDKKFGEKCHPNCDCGRYLEIGNNVFMEYVKEKTGFEKLPKKNVDFGGGLERIVGTLNNDPDIFRSAAFTPIIGEIEKVTGKMYGENKIAMRVIADHMRASVIMLAQGIEPANKQQGYFLRRLIRRSVVKMRELSGNKVEKSMLSQTARKVVSMYRGVYVEKSQEGKIVELLESEIEKFGKTLEQGLKRLQSLKLEEITGEVAFDLLSTYGFPYELTEELVKEKGGNLKKEDFEAAKLKHSDLSRTASAGMFKGGLGSHGDKELKFHTATHLLQAALRKILGDHVRQRGSNITPERLRFDFVHGEKLTEDEIEKISQQIQDWVDRNLAVNFEVMDYETAIAKGALCVPEEKYPPQVKVYSIKDGDEIISQEMCGGPHVGNTGEIGRLELYKQESVSSGVRRVYLREKENS